MVFLILISIALAGFGGRVLWQRRRVAHLLTTPLKEDARAIIHKNVPLTCRLPKALHARLEGLVIRFLDQVTIHGFEGLEVTEEMRLTIAAQACLLLVNKENRWYDNLHTIYLYPGAFRAKTVTAEGQVEHADYIRLGEAWLRGPVVLSWDHVTYGAFIPNDGQNVVLHEFAHQLDFQTGVSDGAPLLDEDHNARQWGEELVPLYERLKGDTEAGRKSFIDPYGATNHAEFFAVATEFFFEKPAALREEAPTLYKHLSQYYRLDPAAWGAN